MLRVLGLWTALFGVACGQPAPRDPLVGDMRDFSYGGDGALAQASASGSSVRFDQFAGTFVWVDYSAPWCAPCRPQARVMRRLEHGWSGDAVVFLSILTSKRSPRNEPADQDTARAWAAEFRLDPAHVLAAAVRRKRILPTHELFSPRGQKLLRMEGFRSERQVRTMLSDAIEKYRAWEVDH